MNEAVRATVNENWTKVRQALLTWRHMPGAVIVATIVLLGGAIYFFGFHELRRGLREQITGRDAEILYALLASQQAAARPAELGELTDDPTDHLTSILAASQFRQLPAFMMVCQFDSKGGFVIGFPEDPAVRPRLRDADFEQLRQLKPLSHYHPMVRPSDLGLPAEVFDSVHLGPVLEVLLPLHAQGAQRLLGVAQFYLRGTEIEEELRQMDTKLAFRAAAAFCAIGAVLTFFLTLAFHQLREANANLLHRTQSLLHANQELALAAKTSAIGAVTAHLIHGLKNPLSGLQSFMAERTTEGPGDESDLDWKAAISTTRRMQNLINETVRVLREQDGASAYELSLEEINELVSARVAPAVRQAGVHFVTRVSGAAQFNNRDANLIVLILENLLTNAIQATPAGQTVSLEIHPGNDAILCEVRDQGPGLPEHLKHTLFKPCQSTKEGGSGIGLAISKQLAASVGAALDLRGSTPSGCVFVLAIPLELCSSSARVTAEPTCIS